MEYQYLQVEAQDELVIVTLNRPRQLNALNIQVIDELGHFFAQSADELNNCRVVILTGSGEKAFAAGADISEIASLTSEQGVTFAKKGHRTMDLIENFHVPVIAAINGYALGGGCELAMACHIRIASDNARLGLPEVGLGLIPGYGGTQRLPQLVGKGNAMRLVLSGDAIDANEALRIGLVSEVVPFTELLEKCVKLSGRIASKGPVAITAAMRAVEAAYSSHREGFVTEVEEFGALISTADAKEGTSAFMEKRKPVFGKS